MQNTKYQDDFNFCLPIDVVKSEEPNADGEEQWEIQGYASTPDQDRQDDIIIQKGLDYSEFIKSGFLNYDHDPSKIVGYPKPDSCYVDNHGFHIGAYLLKGVDLSKRIWETAVALKKSGSGRSLGFSVEGKVLKRDDIGRIIKAKIYHVAVTSTPVNPNATFEAICKSMSPYTEDNLDKALEAGYGDANGSAIIPESLESAFKTLSYVIGDDEEAKEHMNALKQKLENKQEITKSELTLYFQLTKGLSFADSASLVNTIMNQVKED